MSQTQMLYRPSGGVNAGRFLVSSVLAVMLALAFGAGLYLLFYSGNYFVFILPLLWAILVAGVGKVAIAEGHCRNAVWAVVLGLVLGSVMYFGNYYVGFVHETGLQNAHRLDLLPSYIEYRVATDMIEDTSRSGAGSAPQKVERQADAFGWGRFWLEYAICLAFPVYFGFLRARRPYCERCGAWQTQEQAYFPPGLGKVLARALREAMPLRPAVMIPVPFRANAKNTTLVVEYCAARDASQEVACPYHVSVMAVAMGGGLTLASRFDEAIGRMLLRRLVVSEEVVLPYLAYFQGLAKFLGREKEATLARRGANFDATHAPAYRVEHEILTEPEGGRVLTVRHNVCALLLGSGGLVLAFALCATVFFAAMSWCRVDAGAEDRPHELSAVGNILLTTGLAGFFILAVLGLLNMHVFRDIYWRRLLRRSIFSRSLYWVSPDDPDAVLMDQAPPADAKPALLIDTVDLMYVKVDHVHGRVLIEGDKNRYVIPCGALAACQAQPDYDLRGKEEDHLLVLDVVKEDGAFELRLRPLHCAITSRRKHARKCVDGLTASIKALA